MLIFSIFTLQMNESRKKNEKFVAFKACHLKYISIYTSPERMSGIVLKYEI